MRRKIVAGNWKMNGDLAFVSEFTQAFLAGNEIFDSNKNLSVLLAPPSILLHPLASKLEGSAVAIAAQNVSENDNGAYTGEISVAMLQDAGCEWCLVGHSERRALYGETDATVLAKVKALVDNGLKPVLCVGETLEERESGEAEKIVSEQVMAVFGTLDELELQNVIIAYEPVWAIGTGKTASPEQAQDMHAVIRQKVSEVSESLAEQQVILYGGSVNAANASELFKQSDIDGGLVGGASLKPLEFLEICRSI